MSMKETLNEKIIPGVMKFVNLKPVAALKDGILFTLPLTLVGSVFLLLAQLPIPALNEWIASIFGAGWTEPLFQAYNSSFKMIAIVATMGIAYSYAKNEEHEPLAAAVMAFVSFILTQNLFIKSAAGEIVTGVIPMTWTGGEGMVSAIIIGLLVGITYSWFLERKITIKMPAGVPQGVANSFAALIPAAVIILFSTFVFGFFKYVLNTTFIEFIYKTIQTPLQGMSDSLPGVIVIAFLIPFLWWFGVHGTTIVGGVTQGILLSNTASNQAILDSGRELTIANGARIVTQQFLEQFINTTGAGITIGLVICMLFFAKSQQSKQLGRLAIGPGMFNINEPVTFGTPIVMNPFMAIPFILAPVVSAILAYFAIATGLVPPFSGVLVPWTTPPVVAGFILGGWRTAAMQLVSLAVSFFIYFPFFKKVDAMNYKNEQDALK
ncbi:PTS sugar transporter subunit IIC [Clostridium vincentii]|uniref:Permease IIC component n=1 Tax=Clostridium vincentii TaxID=52704 RepID=A0A2T0B689_9CLOT|nr:PTS sugar transporter subunit IIC [Clostridium vincentii]PRR79323.1 Lichenan permease IIC component [Clostridium vincentii]